MFLLDLLKCFLCEGFVHRWPSALHPSWQGSSENQKVIGISNTKQAQSMLWQVFFCLFSKSVYYFLFVSFLFLVVLVVVLRFTRCFLDLLPRLKRSPSLRRFFKGAGEGSHLPAERERDPKHGLLGALREDGGWSWWGRGGWGFSNSFLVFFLHWVF